MAEKVYKGVGDLAIDDYQRGISSSVYTFCDDKARIIETWNTSPENTVLLENILANELFKARIRNFPMENLMWYLNQLLLLFFLEIYLADIQLLSTKYIIHILSIILIGMHTKYP